MGRCRRAAAAAAAEPGDSGDVGERGGSALPDESLLDATVTVFRELGGVGGDAIPLLDRKRFAGARSSTRRQSLGTRGFGKLVLGGAGVSSEVGRRRWLAKMEVASRICLFARRGLVCDERGAVVMIKWRAGHGGRGVASSWSDPERRDSFSRGGVHEVGCMKLGCAGAIAPTLRDKQATSTPRPELLRPQPTPMILYCLTPSKAS